jgi:bifunctional DNA-binding transcriptional regulator/antitoxin component of YhaV-PrlF toxin-antitoxin module
MAAEKYGRALRTGQTSICVILPKEWCEKAGVKVGDNLLLVERDGGMLVKRVVPIMDNDGVLEEEPL